MTVNSNPFFIANLLFTSVNNSVYGLSKCSLGRVTKMIGSITHGKNFFNFIPLKIKRCVQAVYVSEIRAYSTNQIIGIKSAKVIFLDSK
jgi:hypothetical protein